MTGRDERARPRILLDTSEDADWVDARSPTAMLSLDPEVERILESVTLLLQEKHSIDEVRKVLLPGDVQLVRQEYERLQRLGEAQLDAFVENVLRPALMDGRLPGIDERNHRKPTDAIRWEYHVIARCPATDTRYENKVPMTRKLLKRYRDLEYLLADEKAYCGPCGVPHEAEVSFTEYVPRSYEQRLFERDEANAAVAALDLKVKKTEMKGTNTRGYWSQKRRLEDMKKGLEGAEQALADWAMRPNIYRVTARVKGSGSFIYKATDKVTRLDDLVPDEQKQDDERVSTYIKDFLGVTIEVTNETAKNMIIEYFAKCQVKDPANFSIIGIKDYWGPPRLVPQPDGSAEQEGKKVNPDGTVRHEAYHIIVRYAGMPIEVQILEPGMKVTHDKDHKNYKQRLEERRLRLGEEHGIDYDGVAGLFRELLGRAK